MVTADWQLLHVASGDSRSLADGLLNAEVSERAWWDGDDSVLLPAGDWLVRCDTASATCERVAGPEQGLQLP